MNEDLYGMFDKVLQSEYSIIEDGPKKTIELGKSAEYGTMETYSLFDGIKKTMNRRGGTRTHEATDA